MREIEFRGIELSSWGVYVVGEWIYGSYIHCDFNGDSIKASNRLVDIKVDPKTVGQFTGLKDMNGVKIYEGDVVRMLVDSEEIESGVFWDAAGFCISASSGYEPFIGEYYNSKQCEVIGNIHENPELLEDKR